MEAVLFNSFKKKKTQHKNQQNKQKKTPQQRVSKNRMAVIRLQQKAAVPTYPFLPSQGGVSCCRSERDTWQCVCFPSSLLTGLPPQGHPAWAQFLLHSHQQRHQQGHVWPPLPSPRFPSSPRNKPLNATQKGLDSASAQPALLNELQSFCWTWCTFWSCLQVPLPLSWLRAVGPAGPGDPA